MIKIQATQRLKASDDNGDKERLDQLKTQIQDVEADVKEIEEDGDDATFERKHLEKLRDEQRRLKEKMGVGISARLKRLAARRIGIAASIRLAAAGPTRRPELIKRMMELTGCPKDEAEWYLENEDWVLGKALDSYTADKARGVKFK